MHNLQRLILSAFLYPERFRRSRIGSVLRFTGFRAGIPVAHLLHGGLFLAVRKYNAVAAERIVALPLAKVSAVAQNPLTVDIFMPQRLIHIIPDEAALILRVFFFQTDVAFHAAQRIAHVVHILAEKKGLFRIAFQIGPNGIRIRVHPAFHIGNCVKGTVVEHALIVNQPAGILGAEVVRHCQNVLPGVGLVSAGPEQDGNMVFIPLKHGHCPVKHAVLPLREASGNVPAWFNFPQLLPGTVAFQVRLIHHVDAALVAQMIPRCLIGVMAGADSIDMIAAEGLHGPLHILHADGTACAGIPFVTVDPVNHQPLTVEEHDPVLQFKPPETDVVGDLFQNFPGRIGQGQNRVIEIWRFVAPTLDIGEGKFRAYMVLSVKGQHHSLVHQALNGTVECYIFRFTAEEQTDFQLAGGAVLQKRGFQPQVVHIRGGLGVEKHAAEDAAEPEKVLILQPACTAVLIDLHAQAVPGFPDVGSQVKVRGGEAVLGVANEVAVEPDIERLLHTLKGNAHPLPQQSRLQIEPAYIAAYMGVLPVDFRGTKFRVAIPGVQGVDVLNFTIALQLHMSGHLNRAESGIVEIFLPEVSRTLPGIFAPRKAPLPIQALAQRRCAQSDFFFVCVADMVGMSIQTVDPKHSRVREPIQIRIHYPYSFAAAMAVLILSKAKHIAPDHTVFVETVNTNPCRLPFDQRGDGRFPVAKHHFAVV